jgi:hypothetical protein
VYKRDFTVEIRQVRITPISSNVNPWYILRTTTSRWLAVNRPSAFTTARFSSIGEIERPHAVVHGPTFSSSSSFSSVSGFRLRNIE